MKEKKLLLIVILLTVMLILAGCQESDKSKYEKAQSLMAKGQYAEAGEQFSALGSYEESAKLTMYCKAAAAGESGDYDTACSTFILLGDYKESSFMVMYYNARAKESFAEETSILSYYAEAADAYDGISLFRDSSDRASACRQKAYDGAVLLAEAGDFDSAVSALKQLGSFIDSKQLAVYYDAFRLESEGRYGEATARFSELGEYKDASILANSVVERCKKAASDLVASGDMHLEKGEWDEAISDYYKAIARDYTVKYIGTGEGFSIDQDVVVYITTDCASGVITSFTVDASYETPGLGQNAMKPEFTDRFIGKDIALVEYNDIDGISGATITTKAIKNAIASRREVTNDFFPPCDKVLNVYYRKGVALAEDKKWDDAVSAFAMAGRYNYMDANKQVSATRYAEGISKRGLLDWDGAVEALTLAGDYKDAKEQISVTRYAEAEWLLGENRKEEAAAAFNKIATYKDAMERAKQIYRALGDESMAVKNWDAAINAYMNVVMPVKSASARGFGGDVSVTVSFDSSGAIATMSVDAENETAGMGTRAMKKEFTDQFIGKKLPIVLGKDVDALSGSTITSRAVIEALNSITVVPLSDDFVREKINEAYYQKAKSLDSEGKYIEAFVIFDKISGYKDVDTIVASENYAERIYSIIKENSFSKVTVTVTAINSVLVDVKITSEGEEGKDLLTDEIREEWAKAILESGSAAPDAITGATLKFSAASVQEAMEEILGAMNGKEVEPPATKTHTEEAAEAPIEESGLNDEDNRKEEGPAAVIQKVGSAQGLFVPITVYVGFADTGEIVSLVVDTTGETPQLGGQCEKEEFTSQFIGKKLPVEEGIDVISGATVTSKAVIFAINGAETVETPAD